jgi:hypothetical protein
VVAAGAPGIPEGARPLSRSGGGYIGSVIAHEPWLDLRRPTLEPANFDADCERVYAWAIDALQAAWVPFLLAGAFALNVHTGIWRSTKDLDFFVCSEDLAAAYEALGAARFEIDVIDAVWLSKAIDERNGIFVDLIHQNANGLFPVDASWVERSVETRLFGRPVRPARLTRPDPARGRALSANATSSGGEQPPAGLDPPLAAECPPKAQFFALTGSSSAL